MFLKTSPVKQYSYENDFSGVFDALHQSFLVLNVFGVLALSKGQAYFGALVISKCYLWASLCTFKLYGFLLRTVILRIVHK